MFSHPRPNGDRTKKDSTKVKWQTIECLSVTYRSMGEELQDRKTQRLYHPTPNTHTHTHGRGQDIWTGWRKFQAAQLLRASLIPVRAVSHEFLLSIYFRDKGA